MMPLNAGLYPLPYRVALHQRSTGALVMEFACINARIVADHLMQQRDPSEFYTVTRPSDQDNLGRSDDHLEAASDNTEKSGV